MLLICGVPAPFPIRGLIVRLLVGNVPRVPFPRVEVSSDPIQGLPADGEDSSDKRLAVREQAVTTKLLALGGVNAQYMLFSLQPCVVREKHEVPGVGIELVRGLLDGREPLVDPGERLVAKLVRPFYIREDILVRLAEVRNNRLSKTSVRGVTELYGLLTVLVVLEGRHAILDDRIRQEMLFKGLGSG